MNGATKFFWVLVVLGGGYALGSIPWGLLIGRCRGLDIRQHGSGNIGATNVRRVLGRDWGILCFVLDFLKGLLPVVVALALVQRLGAGMEYLPIFAAGAAVAGHVWPCTLGFRGGKGVATTIGALIVLAPVAVVVALISWCLAFLITRYVSIASLSAAVMLPVSGLAEYVIRGGARPPRTVLLLLVALAVVIIVRHRGNLARLRQGSEHRFARRPKRTDRRPEQA